MRFQVTVRLCDSTQTKFGEKAIAALLPVLLNIGLASKVEAVRSVRYVVIIQFSLNLIFF